MKFFIGDKVLIKHVRKGSFKAIVTEDFDTENTQFFPVVLAGREKVNGIASTSTGISTNVWEEYESIPCRRNLVLSIKAC